MTRPNTSSYFQQTMFTCPACSKDVDARIQVQVEFELDPTSSPLGTKSTHVNGRGTVVGLVIHHDCAPKVTRDRERGCFS